MNHKVLLADDSLTIQKVIKITLANQPYDITDCSTEDDLFHQLPIHKPKLIFLDFNLSEKFTGYELTTKIKSILPSTKVLLLLGTFDTVDEALMEKCGASDKIVKPFDSNKFIAICKQLVDTFADDDKSIPFPTAKKDSKSIFADSPEDQWTVGHATEPKFKAPEKELDHSFPNLVNPLQKEMTDWGMSVPGIISGGDQSEIHASLPPILKEVKLNDQRTKKADAPKPEAPNYDQKFPNTGDLDYPTMEDLTDHKPEVHEIKSKLISIDSFNNSESLEIEFENQYTSNDQSDVSNIEAQIRDEVEENLWQADEFEDLKKEVSAKIEEVKGGFQPSRNDFDESLFKPLDSNESIEWQESASLFRDETLSPSVDMSELKREMESMVKKYVKEYMDEMFRKNTEKIAWEVIPDLAENLIRQELSKISHKIINDQT